MAEITSAAPPYPNDAPPNYFSLFPKLKPGEFSIPTKEELKEIVKEAQSSTETHDVDVEVTVFDTFKGEDGSPYGSLRIGLKKPLGILHHYVGYKAPNAKAVWRDISAGIEVLDVDINKGHYRYLKHETANDPYSFDVVVTNFGFENAHFTGTLKLAAGTVSWEGSFITKVPVRVEVPKLELTPPSNLQGTAEELRDILPYAQMTQGDPKNGGISKGEDAAQVFGDRLMSKISFHALDPETKKTLLPQLPELPASERRILDDNPDFFRRFAIHDLAERLKNEKSIDNDIRKHITFKKTRFMRMMSSRTKPAVGEDPFEEYWGEPRNSKNLAIADKLRDQYLDVAQRCYRVGYLEECPRLKVYLEQPMYWFRHLEAYLKSDIFAQILQRAIIKGHTDKNARDAKTQVYEWGQKLALIKSVANPDEQKNMDIDAITSMLNSYVQDQGVKYQQMIDDQLAQHVSGLINEMDDSPEAKEWKTMFDERLKDSSETAVHMKTIAGGLLFQISEESSPILELINRRRVAELPPGGVPPTGPGGKVTFYDIFQELDIMNLEKKLDENEKMITAMPLDQVEREYGLAIALAQAAEREANKSLPKVPFKERVKTGAAELWQNTKAKFSKLKTWVNLVKSILHWAAAAHMFTNILQNHASMSVAEFATVVCHLTAFAMRLVGKALKTILTCIYTKINSNWAKITTGFMTGWLSNAVLKEGAGGWARFGHALIGNLKNTLRSIGLIGMVFSLISCYDEMTKTRGKLQNDDEKKRKIFATIQFVLGILETIFFVAEIGLEMAGMFVAATFCGVASAFFGAVGAIVMVVYILAAMPSPDKVAKSFLKDFAEPLGSYDEKQTVSPEEQAGVKLTDGKIEK